MGSTKKNSLNNAALNKQIKRLNNRLAAARGSGLSVEQLRSEHNFLAYIRLLKQFAQRYTIMIAVADTPCGLTFTRDVSQALMNIGLDIDLFEKFRCAYAALIDAGELVFERISPVTTEIVETRIDLDGNTIELLSVGFNAPQQNTGIIRINGQNHSPGKRGLNFVVYDKVTKFVLDAVNFDTFSDYFACHRPSELADGVARFCKQHPDVPFVCFNLPRFPQADLTANEQFIASNAVGRATIMANLDKPVFAINQYYDMEGIIEVLNVPKSYHDAHGVRRFEDINGKYVNIIGGHRITAHQPEQRQRTVFILGGCNIFGIGASDEYTISSFLQRLLNDNMPEQGIIVQNYGFYLAEVGDAQTGEELAILEALPIKSGDIVLWNFSVVPEMPFIDISQAAMRPRTFEVFSDSLHFTPDGYRLIAEKLFEGLVEKSLLSSAQELSVQAVQGNYGFDRDDADELMKYKQILTDFYDETFSVTMGSIVMNCNPFTLGHRYLIEQALQRCDCLAIFVVQEDQSIFPFEDRMRLVNEGVADLENVVVIPSGRFIISSLTFSEYFNKSEMQERTIDSSMDVTLFAQEIAPCLHITKRFAGEEPFDAITRQYNETMSRILPEYGIEFIEIPRLQSGERTISASLVRDFLEKKDFESIRALVPETTLEYLIKNWA